MMTKGWIAAAGLAAAVFSLPAAAQMNPPSLKALYIGGEIGQAEQKFDCDGCTTKDTKDTGWRLFAGYQFHRMFSAELGWMDFGTAKFGDAGGSATIESSVFDLSVIGALPVGPVSLFLRLGGYHGETKVTESGGGTAKNDKNGWMGGVGVQWDLNKNLGFRGEWKRYARLGGGEIGDYGDGDFLSIGALWRFQ